MDMFKPIDVGHQPVGCSGRERFGSRRAVVVELRKMVGPAERLGRIALHLVNLTGVPRPVA